MSPRGKLNLPVPARVLADARGEPRTVNGSSIELVRESWLIEDRWWTPRPLRRRYWELVGGQGENLVVFHDLITAGWFKQKA